MGKDFNSLLDDPMDDDVQLKYRAPSAQRSSTPPAPDTEASSDAASDSDGERSTAPRNSGSRISEQRRSRDEMEPGDLLRQQQAKASTNSNSWLGQFYSKLNGSKAQLAVAEAKVNRLQIEKTSYQKMLQSEKSKFRRKSQQDREEIQEAHKATSELRASCRRKFRELKEDHAQELRRVKQEAFDNVEAANKQTATAEKSCKLFEKTVDTNEAMIRSLQAVQLKSVEAAYWAPQSASDIEHQITSILKRVRQWSTEYSLFSLDDVLVPRTFRQIAHLLETRGCITDADRLGDALKGSKAMRKPGKAFSMLLTAAASSDIIHKTFANPFFAFVGSGVEERALPAGHGHSLQQIGNIIRQVDEAGAEALRCQTLRLLDPAVSADEDVQNMKTLACSSRGYAAAKIAAHLIAQFKGGMLSEKLNDAQSALQVLAQEAAELSWTLWTRKARIEVTDWSHMGKGPSRTIAYDHANGHLEPHVMHSAALEEVPECLDGRNVVVLCSPLVVSAGNAEGQDYDKKRVLKSAVVWMG